MVYTEDQGLFKELDSAIKTKTYLQCWLLNHRESSDIKISGYPQYLISVLGLILTNLGEVINFGKTFNNLNKTITLKSSDSVTYIDMLASHISLKGRKCSKHEKYPQDEPWIQWRVYSEW